MVSSRELDPENAKPSAYQPFASKVTAELPVWANPVSDYKSDTCSFLPSAGAKTPCMGKNLTSGCPWIPIS